MSNYLGNASLSPAVKDRVLSTFEQTLTLFKQGRNEEVIQGCGLILRMDPMFDPAKKLLEKAKNPNAPIDVDALVPRSAGPAADPMAEAREAMAARDFQRVINITTEVLTNDILNDDARVLNEQAREKMEASPFVDQFARKFDQYLGQGNSAAARAELEKARALDADHPAIARMQAAVGSAAPAAPAPAPPPAAPSQTFSFDATPSFVVDTPAAPPSTGRTAAQASDFGFTFEEEHPAAAPPAAQPAAAGGFSFDTPAQQGGGFGSFSFDTPSAPANDAFANFGNAAAGSAPQTFDFSTAPVETSADDQVKIRQYLADGDKAFDGGDYQQAIDLWSRIFLIDVTNDEASQRIEKAKAKRRDMEQKVEGVLAAGIAAFDKGDRTAAREKFEEVLRSDPGNTSAHEYLERISDTVAEGGAAGFASTFTPPPPAAPPRDLFADDELTPTITPLVPPEPSAAKGPVAAPGKKAAAKASPKAARGAGGGAKMIVIGIVAVVILAAGGWFGYTKFFAKPAYDAAATTATIKQAGALAASGKYDQAIAMLQDVKSEDPQYHTAANMIADLQKKKTQAAEMVAGRPAAVVFQENLASGKQAFDAHDYDAAKKFFDAASRIKAIPADLKPMYDQAAQQVAKLDAAKALFKEQRYADAIGNLQPLLQADPQNQSIKRIITDAHFDLGANALAAERTDEAMKEFDQVLQVDPNDDLAKRSRSLAERYNGQPKDLLYKIYVKYLPLRKVS